MVTASDDATVTAGITPVISVKLASECVNDTPYVTYGITPAGFVPATTPTLTFYDLDGRLVQTTPVNAFTGRVLYPGVAVDAAGAPTDWPGWKFESGSWVTDAADARWRDGLRVVVTVNPTAEATVGYPPPTADCAGPKLPNKLPGNIPLPETGAGRVAKNIRAATILVACGIALTLLRRRGRTTVEPV